MHKRFLPCLLAALLLCSVPAHAAIPEFDGGSYFDENGKPVFLVAEGMKDQVPEGWFESLGYAEYEVQYVEYSHTELRELEQHLLQQWEEFPPLFNACGVVSIARLASHHNRISVGMEKASEEFIALFKELISDSDMLVFYTDSRFVEHPPEEVFPLLTNPSDLPSYEEMFSYEPIDGYNDFSGGSYFEGAAEVICVVEHLADLAPEYPPVCKVRYVEYSLHQLNEQYRQLSVLAQERFSDFLACGVRSVAVSIPLNRVVVYLNDHSDAAVTRFQAELLDSALLYFEQAGNPDADVVEPTLHKDLP